MAMLYDRIGTRYASHRQPDPAIERLIHTALGDAGSVVNVGAGSGSYEPTDRRVVAVEPSITMIDQRPAQSAPVVQARAQALPFATDSFDAALAILTVHHWDDQHIGLLELRRVARARVVVLTWDPAYLESFWLTDYIPEIRAVDRPIFPPLHNYQDLLGPMHSLAVPIRHDCSDGMLCAYWRRPHAYLDPDVRSAISTFAKLGDIAPALAQLQRDLASGEWHRRYHALLTRTELDLGYCLLVTT